MGQQDFGDATSSISSHDLMANMGTGQAAVPQIVSALPIALALSALLWALGFLAAALETYFV